MRIMRGTVNGSQALVKTHVLEHFVIPDGAHIVATSTGLKVIDEQGQDVDPVWLEIPHGSTVSVTDE